MIWEDSIFEKDVFDEDYSAMEVLLTERYRRTSVAFTMEFIERVETGGECESI